MRTKLLALVLILMTATLGVPASASAQTQAAAISGQAVDAGGRALINQRVELVRDGQVVQTTTTGNRGEWTFANVAAGNYVVRIVVNGQVSGIRVPVVAGQTAANALIVAPSMAAASPALLLAPFLFLGPGLGIATFVAIAAAGGFGIYKAATGS